MADRLLVLVPHEHTHAPRSILEQAKKLGPDVTEMRAIKHTMELIAHSLSITKGAPAKVARDGWPSKTALLNGQSMGSKSELHQSPELSDAHWQLIVGLKSQTTRPAKPMLICAKLCPLGKGSPGLARGDLLDPWKANPMAKEFTSLPPKTAPASVKISMIHS